MRNFLLLRGPYLGLVAFMAERFRPFSERSLAMSLPASQNTKDDFYCVARDLTLSERESMERATLELHAEFDAILATREPRRERKKREASVLAEA
jgi:hypothetical protein